MRYVYFVLVLLCLENMFACVVSRYTGETGTDVVMSETGKYRPAALVG